MSARADPGPQLTTAATPGTGASAAALATVGLATACWGLAVWQMQGMDMGVGTRLGSLGFFLGVWVLMMAAMMLPGAAPTVFRNAHAGGGAGAVPVFLAAYLVVWSLVGLAIYALYRPHGTVAAGALVIVAGAYELTPLKQYWRARCRASIRSGFEFGFCCVGSSLGLMVMLVALGAMSVAWMAVIAAVVLGQKIVPANAAIDVPVGLAIIGLGVLILAAPAAVPGLMPAM